MESGDIDTLDRRTQLARYSKNHKPRTLFLTILLIIL